MNGYNPASVPPGFYPHMMYPPHHMMHASHPPPYEQQQLGSIPDGSMYSPAESYSPQHMTPSGWIGHLQMGYSMHHAPIESPSVPATPARNTSEHGSATQQTVEEHYDPHTTPYKYSPGHAHAASPYWGHLDPMMGLATPQAPSAPATPHHGGEVALGSEEGSEEEIKNANNALPLLHDDPPRHTGLRAIVNRSFTSRVMKEIESDLETVVKELLDPRWWVEIEAEAELLDEA